MADAVRRPPRSWEVGTVALLVAVGATAAFSLLVLVGDLALRQAFQSGGVDDVSPVLISMIEHSDALSAVNLMLLFAYLAGFIIWRRRSRDMLGRFVADSETPLRHWSIPAWNAAIGASALISLKALGSAPSNLDEAVSALGIDALRWGVRIVGVVVLMVGIVQIRGQIRRAIAEPRVLAPIVPRPVPVATSVPVAAAAPARQARVLEPVPGAETLSPADDSFWERVRGAAAGADLALLERTGVQTYKWRLVPAGGDVDAVRAVVRPGAVVTVFLETPSGQEPGKAEEFHGFLESEATGAIWYQQVNRRRLPSFLERAATMKRWALYPVQDADAISAVVPAE